MKTPRINLEIKRLKQAIDKKLSSLIFCQNVIYFVMIYVLKYEDNMTEGKVKSKKIVTGDKWKVIASFYLLKKLKPNDFVPLLHMSRKAIKEVETDKIMAQSYVV